MKAPFQSYSRDLSFLNLLGEKKISLSMNVAFRADHRGFDFIFLPLSAESADRVSNADPN
jgi:hypothetical protein